MLRKDIGNFPRPLGIAYIISQFIGGFLGGLVAWFYSTPVSKPIVPMTLTSEDESALYAMIAEALGSFLVVFFYLTQTEAKTVFSKEPAINCFIISSSYVGARAMLNG